MKVKQRFLLFLLALGDIIVLYTSLVTALYLRELFPVSYNVPIARHLLPFTFLFLIWIAVFSLFSLYDPRELKNNLRFIQLFGYSMSVNAIIAIAFFYVVPTFEITPKTNLALFLAVFTVFFFIWRRIYNQLIGRLLGSVNTLVVGSNAEIEELVETLENNIQLGYSIVHRSDRMGDEKELESLIKEKQIELIVVPHSSKHDPAFAKAIIRNLKHSIRVIDNATLYEETLRKIPISSIEETWFIEHFAQHRDRIFDSLARSLDIVSALLLGYIFSHFAIIIAPLVWLTSKGPAIYKQERVGKNGKPFMLYKFRTMYIDAEKNGPQWSSGSKDPRVTPLGRFLRASHLDEIPQLYNILRGDLSVIGPRPERPTFVEKLQEEIPFYELRHLVRPGFTGWAQINYRYGASVEDAYKKLQYDMYYIKNRSISLYVMTMIKTARVFVSNPK